MAKPDTIVVPIELTEPRRPMMAKPDTIVVPIELDASAFVEAVAGLSDSMADELEGLAGAFRRSAESIRATLELAGPALEKAGEALRDLERDLEAGS